MVHTIRSDRYLLLHGSGCRFSALPTKPNHGRRRRRRRQRLCSSRSAARQGGEHFSVAGESHTVFGWLCFFSLDAWQQAPDSSALPKSIDVPSPPLHPPLRLRERARSRDASRDPVGPRDGAGAAAAAPGLRAAPGLGIAHGDRSTSKRGGAQPARAHQRARHVLGGRPGHRDGLQRLLPRAQRVCVFVVVGFGGRRAAARQAAAPLSNNTNQNTHSKTANGSRCRGRASRRRATPTGSRCSTRH